MAQTQSTGRRKSARKTKRLLSAGQVHILATFNNTIVTITDTQGNTLAWGSSGSAGFKGSRKSTAYAAQQVAQDAARQALGNADLGFHPGSGSQRPLVRGCTARGNKEHKHRQGKRQGFVRELHAPEYKVGGGSIQQGSDSSQARGSD